MALLVETAHVHAPFPSPADVEPTQCLPSPDSEEELVNHSQLLSPELDAEQEDTPCTEQEEVPSQAPNEDEVTDDLASPCGQTATTNGETTNGETTGAADAPADADNMAADKGQTQQNNGEVVDESHLTLREEYVDRVWEEFVTHFLLGSCHIQKAAIFDLATRRPLAMSGNLEVNEAEMKQLSTSLHHVQLAYRNGVTIGGKTYKVQLADGRNGILARTDREGCTVCKTHTLIIIGIHDSRGSSRKCNEDVMRLGDFFRKKAL